MLTPLRSKRQWVKFAVYDLEWNPYTLQERCGVVYDGVRHYVYTSAQEMLRYMLVPKNSGLTFYAHNGGRADMCYLLYPLKAFGYNVGARFSGSAANIVQVRKGRYQWHFVDSLWLFQKPLKTIGKYIGHDKGGPAHENFKGLDAERRIKDWYAFVPLPDLIDYCKRDCEILWQAVCNFQQEVWSMGGELKRTIAATSMNLFRRVHLSRPIVTCRAANHFARYAYIASRVEKRLREIPQGFYYDICSSFPYSMTKQQPGNIKKIYQENQLPDTLDEDLPLFFAECLIEVPESDLAPLGFRHESRIYFPVGTWRSWFTGVDLRALLERGGKILKTYRAYEYHPFDDMALYIEEVYSRRQKAIYAGNDFTQMVYKILGNSLYGKYAERSTKAQLIINPTGAQVREHNLIFPKNKEEEKLTKATYIGMGIWTVPVEVNIPHEHVPVAANITAYSRLLILQHMENSLNRGGEVAYCDTDGFATTVEHPSSRELGDLKLEAIFKSGKFYVPKCYEFETAEGRMVKAKGFKLPSDPEHRRAVFDELIMEARQSYDRNVGIWVERMLRPKEMLIKRQTLLPSQWGGFKKVLLENYKRHEFKDGTSRPKTIREIDSSLATLFSSMKRFL